jgi:predicted ATPase
LYQMTKDPKYTTDNIIFCITNQINHGEELSEQLIRTSLDLAELNEKAGIQAMALSDYATARSYLNITLKLLPIDHWDTHYSRSLRLHFLLAQSAYSCGDKEQSYSILQTILRRGHCLGDKLVRIFSCTVCFDYVRGHTFCI